MFGSSSIFILLSIFYYEYIPEDSFQNDAEADKLAFDNKALKTEEKTEPTIPEKDHDEVSL